MTASDPSAGTHTHTAGGIAFFGLFLKVGPAQLSWLMVPVWSRSARARICTSTITGEIAGSVILPWTWIVFMPLLLVPTSMATEHFVQDRAVLLVTHGAIGSKQMIAKRARPMRLTNGHP